MPFKLSDIVVLAAIGSTTVNVLGILFVVAKYLFQAVGYLQSVEKEMHSAAPREAVVTFSSALCHQRCNEDFGKRL